MWTQCLTLPRALMRQYMQEQRFLGRSLDLFCRGACACSTPRRLGESTTSQSLTPRADRCRGPRVHPGTDEKSPDQAGLKVNETVPQFYGTEGRPKQMPNRILREGILTSPKVAKLGWAEEVPLQAAHVLADDYRRIFPQARMYCADIRIKADQQGFRLGLSKVAARLRGRRSCQVYRQRTGESYLEIVNFGPAGSRN